MDSQKIRDAVMQGVSRYYEWREKFKTQWMEAENKAQIAELFMTFPPEMKEAMKQADPKAYEKLTSFLNGGANGS